MNTDCQCRVPVARITGKSDLLAIKEKYAAEMELRTRHYDNIEQVKADVRTAPKHTIMMCLGTSCIASGADKLRDALVSELTIRGLMDRVELKEKVELGETGCNGFCAAGPLMVMYPGGIFYQRVKTEDVLDIVEHHLLRGELVEHLMYRDPVTGSHIPLLKDIPFFARQKMLVLRNKGLIAAENIEEYIARDGYQAFEKALLEMKPEEIVREVKDAGLRGRGGGGFSTGLKWEFCAKQGGDKYILCNADEGDPGAFMDRSLIESDPHAVLEGMMIGARGIGANKGYIYCRAEYPLAIKRLNSAIQQCRERGLLGEHILNSDFSFDIEIKQGSGAFVCGEETALMHSIEGKRGEPRPRPPFPAVKGLWGKPSVLNNVETFANVPLIIRDGVKAFRSIGTEKSPGTKIFALCGNVNNVGLIEVPMGTPLGELIYDIGGGIPKGKDFKAAQIGGPSGGCIPKQHLSVPLDFDSVSSLGAIMGSGGLIVMDESACMVDLARYFMEFVQEESCGKCTPCRVGTKRLLEILTRICDGHGEIEDMETLVKLGDQIRKTSLCGLGKSAPNPVLTTIRYFGQEYSDHILNHRCPEGVCAPITRAPCQSACPAGVDIPGYVSLVGEKRFNEALRLHRNRNPFPQICARVCFHQCEVQCRRITVDEPVSIRNVKRYMVEQEREMQLPEVRNNMDNAKRKVAIIGAGPAGLTCAYFLARLGYMPDVFESENMPGGMLVQAIPAYRLPRRILEREILLVEQLGVKIHLNQKLGRDFTIQGLKDKGYQAFFLGMGAPKGVKASIPGIDAEGVYDALYFLKTYNLGYPFEIGRNVVIVGGGNATVDAARTAMRLGADKVTVVYRRTKREMPAWPDEVEEAEREGIMLRTLTSPVSIEVENGKVVGVRCKMQKLGTYDNSGRKKPVPGDEPEFVIPADQVIAAMGQMFEPEGMLGNLKLDLFRNSNPIVDCRTGKTSIEWIFAGGDIVTGSKSVVAAIGAGERAAVGIDEYLTGEKHAFWRDNISCDTLFDPDADPIPEGREKQPQLEPYKRAGNFQEVELVWKDKVAMRQARRCLRCDYGK